MSQEADFRAIGATTYLCPTPTVLVGCAAEDGWKRGESKIANMITVAWTGICCSHPPMLSVSIRPERHSNALIRTSGEFTVNLVGESLLYAMDFCGVKSGRDMDKFETLKLHTTQAESMTIAPALAEAPAYLCCKVKQIIPLGSHDLFLAEIVQVHVQDQFFREDGSIDEQAMKLVSFVHGKYRELGAEIGFFGFSVAGDAARKRRTSTLAGKKRTAGKTTAAQPNRAKASDGGTTPKSATGKRKPRRR